MNPLILMIVDRALDAIAVGIERQSVREAIETNKPEDIPKALQKMRNDAIAAAQEAIDKE